MRPSAAARSYARALFELARERGETAPVGEALAALAGALAGEPAAGAFFARPWVPASAKRAAAEEIARRLEITGLARDFFLLVAAHGRAAELPGMALAYRDLQDAAANRVRARVRTAVALDEAAREALAARLGAALGGKQVVIEEAVDPGLIGGFVAEVGSYMADGSLDGQLARIRERLARG